MITFIFRCPNTGQNVQSYVAEEIEPNGETFVTVSCLACAQALMKTLLFDRSLARIEYLLISKRSDPGIVQPCACKPFDCRTLPVSANVCPNLDHIRAINPLFSVGAEGGGSQTTPRRFTRIDLWLRPFLKYGIDHFRPMRTADGVVAGHFEDPLVRLES